MNIFPLLVFLNILFPFIPSSFPYPPAIFLVVCFHKPSMKTLNFLITFLLAISLSNILLLDSSYCFISCLEFLLYFTKYFLYWFVRLRSSSNCYIILSRTSQISVDLCLTWFPFIFCSNLISISWNLDYKYLTAFFKLFFLTLQINLKLWLRQRRLEYFYSIK